MDTLIKEYGGFIGAAIGAVFGFSILVLCVFKFKGQSQEMIAEMTGVTHTEYIEMRDSP